MIPIVVAFGPNESYFIQTPSRFRWRGIPERIVNDIENETISHVIHMVLGVDGSYFCSFEKKSGSRSFYFSGLPEDLNSYLNTTTKEGYTIFNVRRMRLTLGPDNKSYFFHDGDQFKEYGLPSGLEDVLSKLKNSKGQYTTPPRLVSLGPNGRYFVVDEENNANWRVGPVSDELDQRLKTDDMALVQDLQLSTHNPGDYFLHLSKTGRLVKGKWSVPEEMAASMNEAGKEMVIRPAVEESSDDDNDSTTAVVELSSRRNAIHALDTEEPSASASVFDPRKLDESTRAFATLALPPLTPPPAFSDPAKLATTMGGYGPDALSALLNPPPSTPSPNFAAAAAIARANQQANSDFAMRQMLQAEQFNNQMRMTTLQNVQAMGSLTLMESASLPIW